MRIQQLVRAVITSAAFLGTFLMLQAAVAMSQGLTKDLGPQPLADALEIFAADTGLQIVYLSKVASGLQTQGAKAGLSAEEALRELLRETGLSFEFLNDRTIAVVDPNDLSARDQGEAFSSSVFQSSGEGTRSGKGTSGDEGKKGFWSRLLLAQDDQSPSSSQRTDSVNQREGPTEATDKSSDKSSRETLGEIIVTATRRAENIRDVPISITAITADEIDRRHLVSAEDYLRGIPGVSQVEAAQGGQAIVIRGIETATLYQNFTSGATVATYFGETSTTTAGGLYGSSLDVKLADIERVEVLRGPQGTAFGSASMGGAVRTIPVAPRLDRFEGKLDVGYSATSGTGGSNYNFQGVGNLPLIRDKLAIRAAGYWYSESGFYRNRAGSNQDFQSTVVIPYGAQAFAVDEDNVGASRFIGGRIAALFQAGDDLRLKLSYLRQKTQTNGYPLANTGTYDQTILQIAPEHVVREQEGGSTDNDIDILNPIMEYGLGWANLLATYSYIESRTIWAVSWSGFSDFPVSNDGPSDHREHVGEIRLATELDGPWNFLAGLYAEDLNDSAPYTYVWYGDPATNPFAAGERDMGVYQDRRKLKQRAAFGEVYWELLRGLTIAGGVRAYEYDRTYRVDADGAFYGADGIHVREDTEASGTNLRGSLSYKFGDDALLYGGWSQGFRLGQLTTGVPPAICDSDGDGVVDDTDITVESTRHVDSDRVDNYELGGKFALAGRRLTIAADVFRMEWSDVPVTVLVGSASGDCNWNIIANAGAARSDGVELQANLQVTDALRIDVGGSWMHARLTEDVPGIGAVAGDQLPGSPKINANLGLQHEFEVAGQRPFIRADAIYIGPFYGNLEQSAENKVEGYVKLDASAGIASGAFNIELFARNLTNEDAFTFRGSSPGRGGGFYGYRPRPRTIGLQLSRNF